MKTSSLTAFAAVVLASITTFGADSTRPPASLTARQESIIAASKSNIAAAPRLNGPRIIGIQSGTPLVHSLAVTGSRPITYAAEALPPGLKLDPTTGIITGTVAKAGDFKFTVRVSNAAGNAQSTLRLVVGDTLALTPPMGWNSYDAFGDSVMESEVLTNAQWLKDHLQPVGWDTVVVDFRWYDAKADGIRAQNPEGVTIDENGRCMPPTNRFPSAADGHGFKSLADRIHGMGLKFGIHIMRGIPRKAVDADLPIANSTFKAAQAARPEGDRLRTCRWNRDMYGVDASTPAGKAWYNSIARQYADWGVDYIKCDDIANLRGAEPEIEALSRGLKESGRSIELSLSPGPAILANAEHLKQFANLWRISGDFWDNWRSLNRNFDLFTSWQTNNFPGHWPDGDMIPFAHICQRNCDVRPDRWTRFTPDEQLTLMSLWALAPSPLMLGMNMPDNDEWTTAIISNDEVLAVNQDALGRAGRHLSDASLPADTWVKDLADGSHAVGFFNRTADAIKLDLPWKQLGLAETVSVRDVWLHRDLGKQERLVAELPPHGCVLVLVK